MGLLQNTGNIFSYSPETRDLLSKLRTKADYLTRFPAGMSPSEKNATINQMVESIQAGKAPEIESMRIRMARQGLLGSGLEETAREGIDRKYDTAVAGAKRDVTIADQARTAAETIAGTNAAAGLAGMLMGGETSEETANAARRAEGYQATNTLLQLLQLLYGQQFSAIAPYAQAVMTQYGGGGNSDWSGLAFLPYLLSGR